MAKDDQKSGTAADKESKGKSSQPAAAPDAERRRLDRRGRGSAPPRSQFGAEPPKGDGLLPTLKAAIELERTQLKQIEAMLRCLGEVLLYADDEDTLMHSDVAKVAARLLNDCVERLELMGRRFAEGVASGSGGRNPTI